MRKGYDDYDRPDVSRSVCHQEERAKGKTVDC
jgi:hypothetical protein